MVNLVIYKWLILFQVPGCYSKEKEPKTPVSYLEERKGKIPVSLIRTSMSSSLGYKFQFALIICMCLDPLLHPDWMLSCELSRQWPSMAYWCVCTWVYYHLADASKVMGPFQHSAHGNHASSNNNKKEQRHLHIFPLLYNCNHDR